MAGTTVAACRQFAAESLQSDSGLVQNRLYKDSFSKERNASTPKKTSFSKSCLQHNPAVANHYPVIRPGLLNNGLSPTHPSKPTPSTYRFWVGSILIGLVLMVSLKVFAAFISHGQYRLTFIEAATTPSNAIGMAFSNGLNQ